MEKNNDIASRQYKLSKDILDKVKIDRKFEIFVEEYTEGDVGCPAGWRPVRIDAKLGGDGGNPILTITSQADMREKMNFYSQLGQRFKIVREINPPSEEDIIKAAKEQGLFGDNASDSAVARQDPESKPQPQDVATHQQQDGCRPIQCVKKQAKIITIGDMQIKYDGDKVYQKQWVRLTPSESSNFRIVSDSTNKLVPMNGKHIEAKRWTIVENSLNEDDCTEEIINA